MGNYFFQQVFVESEMSGTSSFVKCCPSFRVWSCLKIFEIFGSIRSCTHMSINYANRRVAWRIGFVKFTLEINIVYRVGKKIEKKCSQVICFVPITKEIEKLENHDIRSSNNYAIYTYLAIDVLNQPIQFTYKLIKIASNHTDHLPVTITSNRLIDPSSNNICAITLTKHQSNPVNQHSLGLSALNMSNRERTRRILETGESLGNLNNISERNLPSYFPH